MKILICTGIYPPDIGGPAQYAKNLADEFSRRGNKVVVLAFKLEKKLPTAIRHIFYFLRVICNIWGADLIIILDTFSVGWPAVLAAKIFKKKTILRTGGDFLWEQYVERTGDLVLLRDFYKKNLSLSFREKLIFKITKWVLRNCNALVFSTAWQKNIFIPTYELNSPKTYIIENFYGDKTENFVPKEKNFIWAARWLKGKNLGTLKKAFSEAVKENSSIKLEIIIDMPYEDLVRKIQNCYAVIMTSLGEISPNFILDAIRANKPFILTQETGLYDKLKDIGIFVDPLDKEDIKNKILFLADDKNYKEYQKKVVDFNFVHSWQEIAGEFLDIYKTL